MNLRMKEMSKQAHLVADATYAEGPDSVWLKEYNKKFAELIVQECADVCESFGESGDGYTCSAEILEHFGVEE